MKVRREDCPESERKSLVSELHGNVKGSVAKLIYAHDTVRYIAWAMLPLTKLENLATTKLHTKRMFEGSTYSTLTG